MMRRFDADGYRWTQIRLWPTTRLLTFCVELRILGRTLTVEHIQAAQRLVGHKQPPA